MAGCRIPCEPPHSAEALTVSKVRCDANALSVIARCIACAAARPQIDGGLVAILAAHTRCGAGRRAALGGSTTRAHQTELVMKLHAGLKANGRLADSVYSVCIDCLYIHELSAAGDPK